MKKSYRRLRKSLRKVNKWRANIESKRGTAYWSELTKKLNTQIEKLRLNRDLDRTWIHVDMDMFYAAVAILDDPSLADKPIAVGDEIMISTTNYVARKYGVRAAMPGFIGKHLWKDLIFVPLKFQRYREISKTFKQVLTEYDPDLESMGLDEANLDVTDYLIANNLNDHEGRLKLVEEIRK